MAESRDPAPDLTGNPTLYPYNPTSEGLYILYTVYKSLTSDTRKSRDPYPVTRATVPVSQPTRPLGRMGGWVSGFGVQVSGRGALRGVVRLGGLRVSGGLDPPSAPARNESDTWDPNRDPGPKK